MNCEQILHQSGGDGFLGGGRPSRSTAWAIGFAARSNDIEGKGNLAIEKFSARNQFSVQIPVNESPCSRHLRIAAYGEVGR
jgi:hypothetical protein